MPKNYGREYDFDEIPDDEPIAVFRARDICAVEALRFYVKKARAMQQGGNSHLAPDEELLNSISGHADRMETWAVEHGGFKRADL